MTTKRVVELYECNACKAGNFCEHDCIESYTCSVHCSRCNERIWFSGNANLIPKLFKCPYCESTIAYQKGDKYATRSCYKNNHGLRVD